MQRYFLNKSYEENEQITLAGEPYHHIVRVMRMTQGNQVYLAFLDQVIIAEIVGFTADEVHLKEIQKEVQTKELPLRITIASGYPKGDKLELIFQKATEMGAYALQAFPASASVVKWDHKKRQKKQERLQKIVVEAAEQSHRSYCPNVTLFEKQQQLVETFSSYTKVLIAYEESAKQGEQGVFATVLKELHPDESLLLVFGPEGGFSPSEITYFEEHGAQCCGLGPRILRAETAPLYALGAISYQLELLG